MHPHDGVVRLAVLRVALVGADRRRHLGRAAVGAAGHQRRDRRRRVAAVVGVVGHAVAHQVGAEVGVAEAELAEGARVGADLLGRVARGADDDLLGEQHDVDGVLEGPDVELPSERRNFIRLSEARLQAESSTCMYSLQGFEALMRPLAGQVCHVVDGRVVLDAGVSAAPCGLGDLVHQFAGAGSARRWARRSRGRSGASRRPPRRRA